MRVLVTGATGFIGRNLVKALLSREDVSVIYAVSRKRVSHRSDKIIPLKVDISNPGQVEMLPRDVDAIFHLAGSYDFSSSDSENYRSNVVATQNLIDFASALPKNNNIKFFYASTYAVFDPNKGEEINEGTDGVDVHSPISYVSTKACAESILSDSDLSGAIFRIGVVVGDSKDGSIVKYDGPYFLLKLFSDIKRRGLEDYVPVLPLPISKNANVPLVPVDLCAQVFSNALDKDAFDGTMSIVGIYGKTVDFSKFIDTAQTLFKINPKIHFLEDYLSKFSKFKIFDLDLNVIAQKVSSFVSKIPQDSFKFLRKRHEYRNPNFDKIFPEVIFPEYEEFEKALIKGFKDFEGDSDD